MIVLKAGFSTLTFIFKEDAKPYHFAFNIPPYAEEPALKWLKGKVEILLFMEKEIVDFENWNAKSIYFYDSSHNVVELIARRNLQVERTDTFDAEAILNISEIGMAADDIQRVYLQLNEIKPLPVFDTFDAFCAAGDEEGLFIIVDKSRKRWFPANDKVCTADFKITGDYNFVFEGGSVV
jgi:hypothetical protein